MFQNNFLLLGHNKIASETLRAAELIYKKQLNNFHFLNILKNEKKINIEKKIIDKINSLSQNKNLLILADVYGCTHSNIILSQKKNNFFSCVFGFNLPILLKIINYKNLKLDEILKKTQDSLIENIKFIY